MKPLEEPVMVLKFKCACGQTITAKAEYVGRRVQCVGCKKILLVPGAERKPAPKPEPEPILAPPVYTPEPNPLLTMTPSAPEVPDLPQVTEEFHPAQLELPPAEIPMVAEPVATMMPTHDVLEDAVAEPPPEEEDILDADVAEEPLRPTVRTPAPPPPSNDGVIRFRCACGATFQAARVHAGEPTRCARCSDVLFIPTRTQALKADGRPIQVSFAPTERGRKESSRKGLAVALVLLWLVVIGGGGYAYWEFYGRTTIEQETGKGGVSVRTAGIPGGGAGMMQMQPGGAGGLPGGMGGGRPGGAQGQQGGRPGGAQGQQGGRPGGAQGQQGGRPGGALGQQGGPPPQARQVQIVKDGENAALKPLDLVPATALGFASIRLAEALAEPDIKKSLENPLFKDGLAQLEFAEMMLGSKLEDVERVIVVAPQADPMEAWGVIQVKKPFQREKLLTAAQMPAPQFVGAGQKKRAYYVVNNTVGLHFVNDNVLVAGPKAGVESYLKMGEPAKQGPLAAALKEAEGKRQLVVAANVPDDLRKEWLDHAPPALGPFKDFLAIKSVQWVSDFRVAASTTLEAVYADADKAKAVKPALEGLIKQARDVVKPPLVSADLQKLIGVYFDGVSVTQKDALVKVDVKELDAKTAALLQEELRKLQEEATKKVREAAARTVTMNNFKQLGIAVHNYASVYNQLPPAVIAKDGKPLFSWRVALLPYVEQDNLYKQLKLDEPWNSEHNKKVLERVPMPKVFEVDGVQAPANTTHIQLFSGKDTVFPGQGKVNFQNITDGLSNTILFIEAAKPVHWAEPTGDIAYSANVNPLTQIRKRPAGCLAALCDGSVRMLSPQLTEKTLRNLIMPADGNVVNLDE